MKALQGNTLWLINFVVDAFHVSTSDRDIIREFRTRIKMGDPVRRTMRKRIYQTALRRHHSNRALYNRVVGAHFK